MQPFSLFLFRIGTVVGRVVAFRNHEIISRIACGHAVKKLCMIPKVDFVDIKGDDIPGKSCFDIPIKHGIMTGSDVDNQLGIGCGFTECANCRFHFFDTDFDPLGIVIPCGHSCPVTAVVEGILIGLCAPDVGFIEDLEIVNTVGKLFCCKNHAVTDFRSTSVQIVERKHDFHSVAVA